MEWIAHRAGNLPATLVAAVERADAIELDVHLFRGRLEVRHGKVLWPFARLWERWELLPSDADRPELSEIVDSAPAGTHLWLDLKGFTPRLTRRVLAEVGEWRPLTVSTRSWWALGPARDRAGIRTMRSVGNRWQRWLAGRLRYGELDGIVIHERLVNAESLERLHRRTPTVISWGVTDSGRASELRQLGISGLIVDDLALIDREVSPAGPET